MKLKEKTKNNLSNIAIVIVFVVLLIQIYANNNIEYELDNFKIRNNALVKNLEKESEFEGNYIWDLINVFKDSVNLKLRKEENNKYFVVVWVDSITCLSCFIFHMENINELFNVAILIYSPNNSEYVQSFLKNGIILQYVDGESLSENIVINFVDGFGKIIYSDIADKLNYDKSRRFYKKIKKFMSD